MFEGLFRPTHLLVIFVLALLIFGPRRLPEFGKVLGQGFRGLKSMFHSHDESAANHEEAADPTAEPRTRGLLSSSKGSDLKN
jgi:sec-independent protein translocase protein TatA